ncbi:MAG: SIMPL domain-containing protein [Methanothrix sp.]
MTQQDLALTLAIEGVSRKAEVAAEAAGLILGKVLEISEGYGYVAAKSQSAVFDMATPIQPGQMEITASVTMTYEIS